MKLTMPALAAEYRALAQADPAALRRDFAAIVDYMKNSTAIHHGEYVRTCFSPKLMPTAVFDRLAGDMRLLYGIFGKVIDAYFEDAAYRALFGFDARTEDLILHARRSPSLLPMARIDFFYNEETGDYTFCEFNTDGTSAMNEDRELHNAQALSAAYRAFTARHRTRVCELFDSWVATVRRLWQQAGGTGSPCVAIVDYLECGTVHEFEIFRRHFEDAGLPALICDVRRLRYEDGVLRAPDGRRIDVAYRRAVTSDLLAHYDESAALRQAARDGHVLLLGDFHTQIVHNKELFRVLQTPETAALLTPQENAYLAAHLPATMPYTPARRSELLAHKDAWILKPSDSYGSRGVHAGVEHTEAAWRAVVESLPETGYLMQAFHTPYVTEDYGLDAAGNFGRNRYYNLTGLYVYDGTVQGVYSRVSLTPIISSQYSEKTLATTLVES